MSNLGGVLGENTNTAVGTYTLYQVATAKWARGRFFMRAQAGAGGTATLALLINGVTVAQTAAFTASHFVWTKNDVLINSGATAPTGASGLTVLPFAYDFYLSALDLVQYTIAGEAFTTMRIQFVGVELNAS